jgi:Flp pilus assembly protein TadD
LLQAGIAAARAKERQRARELLMQVVDQDERNVTAWLWLSGVTGDLEERAICLENVLALEPDHDVARRGLELVHQQQARLWTRDGIAAARQGQLAQAYELLSRAVAYDGQNSQVWYWLGQSTEDLAEREECLQKAVALAPTDPLATRALAEVRRQRSAQPPVVEEPTVQGDFMGFATMAEHYATDLAPASAEVVTPTDDFANELLCPYCGTLTREQDRHCRACGNSLWINVRRREGHSGSWWILMILQVLATLGSILMVVGVPYLLASLLKVGAPSEFLALYLGQPHHLAPRVAQQALALVPRLTYGILIFWLLLAGFCLLGLLARWRAVYYLLIVDAVFTLIYSIANIALAPAALSGTMICAQGPNVVLSILQFIWTLKAQDDLFTDRQRLLLRLDHDAKSALVCLERGQLYFQRQMWALAAIHLRLATGTMTEALAPRLNLALAYHALKRDDLAERALAEARALAPNDPRVLKLAAKLRRKKR